MNTTISMQAPKSSKHTKPSTPITPSRSSSSSLSSHLAMVELKQRILTSLSKLSDRDTHQIAIEDLEKIIQTLSNDGVPMLLNCLYDATNDPKPAVKRESIRLLAVICTSHTDSAYTHLTKIIAHIVKRLKDSDSAVRDACRDSIGSLASLYLKGEASGDQCAGLNSVVSLFVKPLFESMGENNKTVQSGAAICLAKMVECTSGPPVMAFQKLCPRICKYLSSPNFIAKASLLPVVSSLSQVGAIAPQSVASLIQCIHECLSNSDWATRKAAADTLSALALHSSHLLTDGANSTVAVLEACRFDKIKPVRDSLTEALQLWKKIAGEGDEASDEQKGSSHDEGTFRAAGLSEKKGFPSSVEVTNDQADGSSSAYPYDKDKGTQILDKAVGILRKKAPTLTDKELNPEFFQKLGSRGSDDLPVEVAVPRRCVNSSNLVNDEGPEDDNVDSRQKLKVSCKNPDDGSGYSRYQNTEKPTFDYSYRGHGGDGRRDNQRDFSNIHPELPRNIGVESESSANNRGNWLTIQRQLLQLERQQAHLMNVIEDFMGGSQHSMVTLENRVRGLERVVEDLARDLAMSSGRKATILGFDGSSSRTFGKYNGFGDYSTSDGSRPLVFRGRGGGSTWRGEAPEGYGQMGSRRGFGVSPKSENDVEQVSSRRAWDRGVGPIRFGEGPSARSVWQASKDEATLEAIRVAGDDNGTSRSVRVSTAPELTAEALGDDGGSMSERDKIWNSWRNAMDAVHAGDMDSAFADVLSTGDDSLLVKLMDKSGPVIDQLSSDVAIEVLNAISQFLLEQDLYDISLSWVQQLVEMLVENGSDVLVIPDEVKREVLLNLHEAASAIEVPEDWEGALPDQLLYQLVSAWDIDLKQLQK